VAAIDVGPGAADYDNDAGNGYTNIDLENHANDAGAITSFELFLTISSTTMKAGTFSGTAPDFTSRDVETIGSVTAGSKQTFSGLDCDVESGDYAGCYFNDGAIEMNTSGHTDVYRKSGDQFGAGQQTYTQLGSTYCIGIYGTGATAGWANIAKVNGVTATDLAKVRGIAVADIAKRRGIAV
jgi:hypothetical protein